MNWATPRYSVKEVDKAGRILVDNNPSPDSLESAFDILNNWRASHAFPLNTFHVTLRAKGRRVDETCVTAQRIKRLDSIHDKLHRFSWLSLGEMQDIGGCRAILDSVKSVRTLVKIYEDSDLKHKLDDKRNYIDNPKRSGYRGIHLIYRYRSDRKQTYNGLKIEMQFRSPLQHAWATAVETVGTFLRQSLKASRGEEEWLRFFALMGTAIAMREKTPLVPNTPTDRKELVSELNHYVKTLDVETRLTAYGDALNEAESDTKKAHYFLLEVNPSDKRIRVTGYTYKELEKAAQEYLDTERSIADHPGSEAVLVSVESLTTLRRAYPNYFLDTKVFLSAVRRTLA
jgi:hypothetical protein